MKVRKCVVTRDCFFSEIEDGSVFEWDGRFFMKIVENRTFNAIRLSSGTLFSMQSATRIIPVNGEFVITEETK